MSELTGHLCETGAIVHPGTISPAIHEAMAICPTVIFLTLHEDRMKRRESCRCDPAGARSPGPCAPRPREGTMECGSHAMPHGLLRVPAGREWRPGAKGSMPLYPTRRVREDRNVFRYKSFIVRGKGSHRHRPLQWRPPVGPSRWPRILTGVSGAASPRKWGIVRLLPIP